MINMLIIIYMRNIAIFASGTGTNAENIIKYFSNKNTAKVGLVLSNKREASVLKRAAKQIISAQFFSTTKNFMSPEKFCVTFCFIK